MTGELLDFVGIVGFVGVGKRRPESSQPYARPHSSAGRLNGPGDLHPEQFLVTLIMLPLFEWAGIGA